MKQTTFDSSKIFQVTHRYSAQASVLPWFLTFVVVTAVGICLLLPSRAPVQGEPGVVHATDDLVFYAGGKLVVAAQGGRLYDVDEVSRLEFRTLGLSPRHNEGMAFLNPPFVALFFAPLSLLPYDVASIIVTALDLTLAVVGAAALVSFLQVARRRAALLLLVGFLTSVPVLVLIHQGQLSMILFFGWFGFVSLQVAGRQRASGLALALLLVKPQMAILPLAMLLWKRQWAALRNFAVAATALGALSLVVAGPGAIVAYPKMLLNSANWDAFGVHPAHMFGWSGLVASIFPIGSVLNTALSLLLTVGTVALLYRAWAGPIDSRSPRFLHACGALLAASLLINPHLYWHDLTLVTLPLAWAASASMIEKRGAGPWSAVAAFIWLDFWVAAIVRVNIVTPMIAVLFLTCVYQARRTPASNTSVFAQEEGLSA